MMENYFVAMSEVYSLPVNAMSSGKNPLVVDNRATTERSVFQIGVNCSLPWVLVLESFLAPHDPGPTVTYAACCQDREYTV